MGEWKEERDLVMTLTNDQKEAMPGNRRANFWRI